MADEVYVEVTRIGAQVVDARGRLVATGQVAVLAPLDEGPSDQLDEDGEPIPLTLAERLAYVDQGVSDGYWRRLEPDEVAAYLQVQE